MIISDILEMDTLVASVSGSSFETFCLLTELHSYLGVVLIPIGMQY